MKVGIQLLLQNDGPPERDGAAYATDLALADLAEPLGFDSLWGVEHHFTGYSASPSPLQLLAYLAGRYPRMSLGAMVVVLPWHHPARVAGEIAMLDQLSCGRFTLGIGRGLARDEFEGLGIPLGESRERFVEAAELVLNGLETGRLEYAGKHYKQPARALRPHARGSFRGRTYAAAVSPESVRIMARLGVGILVIPQKPWPSVEADLVTYRSVYREVNGVNPPPTLLASQVYCHEDADQAAELAHKHIGNYYLSVMRHYELLGEHLKHTQGYEFYAANKESMEKRDLKKNMDFYTGLQVWGTPQQCFEKILAVRERIGCDGFVANFRYAGITGEEAEHGMRLFAKGVLPRLKQLESHL